MHKCLRYSLLRVEDFGEEHSWGIALYIELHIDNGDVVVCRHPSYAVIEDLKEFARRVYDIRFHGEEIEVVLNISRLLDFVFPDWKKDFEIIIRKKFISISVYL